ncbi:MAG: sensor domain-containing diguanylate cyclase [Gammaproteobacteria bacterium]|nr:sensor domain-containing diguanylate cyclase [Gammaproteobacteria bacterium]
MMTHRNASIYYAAFESSRDAIVLIEGDRFVKCNDAAVTMFEAVTKDGLLDSSPSDFSPSTQPDGSASEALSHTHIQEAMEKGSALFEWTHRTLRGRSFLAEVQLSRVDTGKGVLVQGVVRDITERRATELALQRSNEQLEHFRTLVEDAIDQSRIGLFILDDQYRVVWVSHPVKEFLGIEAGEAIDADKRDLARERIAALFEDGQRYIRNTEAAYENGAHLEGRVYHVLPRNGLEERWLEHQSYPITSGVYAGGRIDIYRDLTERIELEHELSHRATHDYLTGLLNRQQFEILLDQEMNRSRRYESPLSLVMFDLDHFKRVNDDLGHEAGDKVLQKLARELRNWIRDSDSLARWGGEEFTLMLPDCDAHHAEQTAEHLRTSIMDLDFGEKIEQITVSFGVTQCREKESRREVIRRADDALYTAKQKGRNRVIAV